MYFCGYDVYGVMLLGFVYMLNDIRKDLKGRVLLVF